MYTQECKTGVVSLAGTPDPQVCCPAYCGECSDYPDCASVRGQDSFTCPVPFPGWGDPGAS